ncbi:hypothetical protein BDQ12DRAFT_728236 [Crucibulum laeve]|uniref:Hexosyltransferase n=1 Tax=Crucibulum laeve TaxID=68775 RepID=A0A5C3LIH2_9AGAR|nr:hypothetical protein BDQ12DRAFT_728236 [Crucibulum laeve]
MSTTETNLEESRICLLFIVFFFAQRSDKSNPRLISGDIPDNTFAFDQPKPAWYELNPERQPLVLRLAIITRVDAFERREALRAEVLAGILPSDVVVDYRFFVGSPGDGAKALHTRILLNQENTAYGDVEILNEIPDIFETVAEKRFAALKWGGLISNDSYDYFMTMDSDTFCRFGPLARRLPELLKEKELTLNPRVDPIMIGRMGSHLVYWQNRVPDGSKDLKEQDEYVKGPWYSYPSGIGSSLVHSLLDANPPIPHHIHYPWGDVMIGSWVAALENFPDASIHWESTPEHSPEPVHEVFPTPYASYVVKTEVIDDFTGWHDYPKRGGHDARIGWDSVCIHRLKPDEMVAFRQMEEIKGEWDTS